MNPEMIDLAKRLVACKSWRWMPGMLAWRPDCPPVRIASIEDAGNALQENGWLPELSDPATLGCLLALVREAHGEETAHTRPFKGRWLVERETRPYLHEWLCSCGTWGEGEGHVVGGDTEAEALVAAFEAAP